MPLKEVAVIQLLTQYIGTLHVLASSRPEQDQSTPPTFPFYSEWLLSCIHTILNQLEHIYPFQSRDTHSQHIPEYVPLVRAMRELYREFVSPLDPHELQDRPSIPAQF